MNEVNERRRLREQKVCIYMMRLLKVLKYIKYDDIIIYFMLITFWRV